MPHDQALVTFLSSELAARAGERVTEEQMADAPEHMRPRQGRKRTRTPDSVVPSDVDLVVAVVNLARRCPGTPSLREVCAAVWPDLPWTGGTGADSAMGRSRTWQIPPRPGSGGNRAQTATAAAWLLDRLQDLVIRGKLRAAPRRRDEVDILASVAFLPVAAAQGGGAAAHDGGGVACAA